MNAGGQPASTKKSISILPGKMDKGFLTARLYKKTYKNFVPASNYYFTFRVCVCYVPYQHQLQTPQDGTISIAA
jgi:hypothetical protein